MQFVRARALELFVIRELYIYVHGFDKRDRHQLFRGARCRRICICIFMVGYVIDHVCGFVESVVLSGCMWREMWLKYTQNCRIPVPDYCAPLP